MFARILAVFLGAAGVADAETKDVFLEEETGTRHKVATLTLADDGGYDIRMEDAPFSDFFLSMRPFKCLTGPDKHWCHVPYPYQNARNIGAQLTDLEYDLLFIWKGATEYGINMWNGVYYVLEPAGDGRLVGQIHEMNMDILAVPPEGGDLRPIQPKHLEPGAPESHWLPRLVVE